MSTRAYTDGRPHIDDPPAYSPPDTYPPTEHGVRLADTPAFEDTGAYDEQDESAPWRRSVEGEVSDLHLASEAEKKRLWWRNAVINAIFIAAWCVHPVLDCSTCTHVFLRSISVDCLCFRSCPLEPCWPFLLFMKCPLLKSRARRPRFSFGLLISLYNKYMFSPERFGFPYPLFATFTQMIVQFVLASALRFGLPRVFRPKLDPDRKQWM